jgi:hypothetical protein
MCARHIRSLYTSSVKSPARRFALPAPSLTWLWYAVPILLVAHAIAFWGRGILDEEGMFYIQKYLADRPLLATIFDPNDATLYQARELSYLFDVADARSLAWLLDRGVIVLIPASGALGLIAVALIYLRGAQRAFRFEASTGSLLLSLFLSCIVTQASTAIFYRSAKMVLTAALFAFLFSIAFLLRSPDRPRAIPIWRLSGVTLLGLIMSLADRQGLFYLLTTTLTLTLLWLAAIGRGAAHAANRLQLAAACATAALTAMAYGYVIAPWIIAWTTGNHVTFAYQQQSFTDLNWTRLSHGFEMFSAQVRYLFGNAPFLAAAATAVIGGALGLWRHQSNGGAGLKRLLTNDVFIVSCVVPSALVLLLALMVLYHPPIYDIPDHTLWYYTLTVPAVLVFGLTMILARVDLVRLPVARHLIHATLVGLIASNVLHYDGQRRIMIESSYFSEQYTRTRQILRNADDASAGRSIEGRRPWLRVGSFGAAVALPIEDEAFLAEVQAAYATYRRRRPLDDATGPFWSRLYEFLRSSPTLFDDPEGLNSLVDGLRSVGVRRVELNQERGRDYSQVLAVVEALRIGGQTTGETTHGDAITLDLAESVQRPAAAPLRQIAAGSFVATASYDTQGLSRAFDRDDSTYWSTNGPQTGREWIRIEFDRPVDVGCVRLLFNAANPGRDPEPPPSLNSERRTSRQEVFKQPFRPRGLVIDAGTAGDGGRAARFNPLGALLRGLLRDPERPTMDFWLAPNRGRALVLRQTGRSATDPWNVSELTVWERR